MAPLPPGGTCCWWKLGQESLGTMVRGLGGFGSFVKTLNYTWERLVTPSTCEMFSVGQARRCNQRCREAIKIRWGLFTVASLHSREWEKVNRVWWVFWIPLWFLCKLFCLFLTWSDPKEWGPSLILILVVSRVATVGEGVTIQAGPRSEAAVVGDDAESPGGSALETHQWSWQR